MALSKITNTQNVPTWQVAKDTPALLNSPVQVFEKYRTSIDMITTSEVAVSLTIDNSTHLDEIIRELEPFGTVELDKDQAIVSIVGNEIGKTEHILSKLFESIADIPVRMVSYGGSPHNVSLLVPASYKTQTLQVLNKGIFGLD